jgi:hypothetical protein
LARDREGFLEGRSVMGDKSQKDKNKALKQKAAREAKKEKKKRDRQEKPSSSTALLRQS